LPHRQNILWFCPLRKGDCCERHLGRGLEDFEAASLASGTIKLATSAWKIALLEAATA
jgi:hypothetical protein